MPSHVAFVVTLVVTLLLVGCAKPTTQWWRIGNCLVLYDQTGVEKQLVAVGQGCEIRRDTLTAQGDVN